MTVDATRAKLAIDCIDDLARPGERVSIDPRLLKILVCPVCREEVRPVAADSGLECVGCRRIYPIRDGIPVMLVEEASQAAESGPA